jgi:acyl-CoA synthetase (NDP forming)
MAGLSSVFRPSSIAVVGASDRVGSRGAELLDNLHSVGFEGTVYRISRSRPVVAGVPTYPTLSDVGAPIEAVAICVDHANTLSAVKEAVSLRAKAVLVLGTGYAEAGPAGARLQDEIASLCHDAGITLVGPNCLGPWSRLDHVSYWLAPGSALPLSGIGLVTQSGALAAALMEPLSYRGIACDAVATSGNEAGVGIADFLAHFADDPRIRVIGLIVESIRRPEDLLAAVRLARSNGKAVVGLLIGTSEAGRDAALAHTAALVGDGAVAGAFLREAGALLVDDLAQLTEQLVLFSAYPGGLQAGLAVTTVSGGGSGLVADLSAALGAPLAPLRPETLDTISGLLGGKVVANPIDVALAGDVPGVYQESVAAVAADPNVGTVAIGLNLPHAADPAGSAFYAAQVEAAEAAVALGRDAVAFALVPGEPDEAMRAAAHHVRVPVLLGGREALRAIANAIAHRAAGSPAGPPAPSRAAAIGNRVQLTGEPTHWDEFDVRAALSSYGIPIAVEELVHSRAEAAAAAGRIGLPVALKVVAGRLAHKSDHGALRLGLGDAEAVRRAYSELEQVAGRLAGIDSRGVSVQAMVPPGTELILGSRRDVVFGRTAVLSWGGLWVEAFPNAQVGAVPLGPDRAWQMIDDLFGPSIKRARLIADLDALHAALLAFSDFVADLPDAVDVVEINPLILGSGRWGGVTAIDAAVQGSAS